MVPIVFDVVSIGSEEFVLPRTSEELVLFLTPRFSFPFFEPTKSAKLIFILFNALKNRKKIFQ